MSFSGGTKALGRFCGNSVEPKNVTSAGNELHVVFQSDHFSEFSGFKLRYFFLGSKAGMAKKGYQNSMTSFHSYVLNVLGLFKQTNEACKGPFKPTVSEILEDC